MKHVYRAYPSAANRVQAIASLAVGGSLLARGISHDPRINAALLGLGALGVLVQVVRFVPGRVLIGDDGVLVRWLWSRTFVRRSAIASIEQPNKTRLRILKKDGGVCEFDLLSQKSVAPLRADLARLAESLAVDGARSSARRSATFEALAARVAAWARAPDAARGATGATGAPDSAPASLAYRSGDSPEQLWEIAADVDAPALARIGAVHALGPLDDAARARVHVLADASAEPPIAAALAAAATGDAARMRAILIGSSGGASGDASLPSLEAEQTGGAMPALLHPNRAVLAVAWLSRLWFLAPLLTLLAPSSTLAAVSFLACAFGAMPWAAAREMDPLIRVVPGRVDVEDGFLVQGGERMLDLATVTAAFIHYRSGAAPVVRLEGKQGWPLLDVRTETLDEARAFLRRLPLTDAQREARFGTMHPGTARFVTVAIMMAVAAAAILLMHVTTTPGLVALGGLTLAATRVRRLLTVKRDGLVLRSPWNSRFIRWDDVATVERRKGAGVVVLKTGERVMLRSIAGDPTSQVDDDLTETVIDRLAEMRAAPMARARVESAEPDAAAEALVQDDDAPDDANDDDERDRKARRA